MHEVHEGVPEPLARARGKPDEDHARSAGASDEGEPPEVLVLGEEDPVLASGERDDLCVDRPGRLLGERADVVSGRAKCANDREVEVLVGEEAQAQPACGRTITSWATESAA